MAEDRFQVWTFYENETYREVPKKDGYTAEESVLKTKELIEQKEDQTGPFHRITITDRDDMCCFDWQLGKGIVFPPPPTGHQPA